MTSEKEDVALYVSANRGTYKLIKSWAESQGIPPDEVQALLIGATKPLFYVRQESWEKGALEQSSQDQAGSQARESGAEISKTAVVQRTNVETVAAAQSVGPAQQGGMPKCVKCGKEFSPKTFGATKCFECWKSDNPLRKRR